VCPRDNGNVSKNAIDFSVSVTILAGISFLAILQKIQSMLL
jgi:hypothetical protein